jgi:zinc protease
MEDLDAASLEDVSDFFRTHYAPNNAVLSVVGDFDADRARGWIERYFGPIAVAPTPPDLGDLSLPLSLGGERREVVRDRVPLPRVFVGYRAPVFGDPRLKALEMAGQVIAGGKGSRLHRRLVREERIAQDVTFFVMAFVGGASIAAGWATVRPGIDVDRVEAAYLEELARIALEPVTDDELGRAKALVETEHLAALQRVEDRADQLSMWATLFDDPARMNDELAGYLAVTAEDIRSVAAEVFREENRVVITYLPAEGDAEDAGDEGEAAADAAAEATA